MYPDRDTLQHVTKAGLGELGGALSLSAPLPSRIEKTKTGMDICIYGQKMGGVFPCKV